LLQDLGEIIIRTRLSRRKGFVYFKNFLSPLALLNIQLWIASMLQKNSLLLFVLNQAMKL
jgi:hypothetical protein